MSTKEQIAEALHINTTDTVDPESRLIICIKKNITKENGEIIPLDIGHFGLICAHSTGIAFNAWDGFTQPMNWYPEYPNLIFTNNFTKENFINWRINSFRKLVLQINSDKEFNTIKSKLIQDQIPFRICGEIAFGQTEVAIVIFPLTKQQTPKYLKFLSVYK